MLGPLCLLPWGTGWARPSKFTERVLLQNPACHCFALCPSFPLQGFPKVLLLSAFQEDSPQAVKEPREVRTRAKSHILEREPLLCTQVSVLLTGAVSVPAPSSLHKLPLQLLNNKQISPPFLVGGWNV